MEANLYELIKGNNRAHTYLIFFLKILLALAFYPTIILHHYSIKATFKRTTVFNMTCVLCAVCGMHREEAAAAAGAHKALYVAVDKELGSHAC
jgi:hypothetical protein